MNLNLIVCTDLSGAIGYENQCMYDFPEDKKFFKNATTNSVVIMGRKTFDSIGKCLPNRINVVVTKNREEYKDKADFVCESYDEIIKMIKIFSKTDLEVFAIGGSKIYELLLNEVNYAYITLLYRNSHILGEKYDSTFPIESFNDINWESKIIQDGYSEKYKCCYEMIEFKRK